MTLDEWISLTAEERNRERSTWQHGRGYWRDLLREATDRFKRHFRDHPVIYRISPGAWHEAEPAILVVTALHAPLRLEELPDRFCTFSVRQWPVLDNKDCYLKRWSIVLGELLGWSEQRVRDWARDHHEDGLNGKDDWFYHEHELDHVTGLLVPDRLRDRLSGLPLVKLRQGLREAIEGDSISYADPSHDWEAARVRVKNVLAEYERDA